MFIFCIIHTVLLAIYKLGRNKPSSLGSQPSQMGHTLENKVDATRAAVINIYFWMEYF